MPDTDLPSRMEILEDEFTKLQAQNATIISQQAEILNRLGPTPNPAAPSAPTIPIPAPSGTVESKLKPASPDDFDGNRSKGRAFLNSCELYFTLVPHHFPDETTAVRWAISYMKTGRAALFAQRAVRHQAKHSVPKYTTWDQFREAFISEFCPKNETQLALAKLETMTYHQGKRSVDEYVDDFRELIEQAGYTEGLAIVVKFRRGLAKGIQDQIANIPIGRPSDNDPEAWYNAAIRADENRIANNLFHSGPSSTTTTRTPGIFPAFSRPPTFTPLRPPPPPEPTPMEIDATRKRQSTPDVCRRCGKPGHWAKNCEKRFDIRFMLAEEKSEWLQNFALEADTPESKEEVEEPEVDPPPDFQSCSE
jgi:hypothetical protein